MKKVVWLVLVLAAPAWAQDWRRSWADRWVFAESVAITERVRFQNRLPQPQIEAIAECQRHMANGRILAEYNRFRSSVEFPPPPSSRAPGR